MNNDKNHPWFRPVWRRVLMVVICAAIALWDVYHGNYGWALIFGGLGGYAVYIFFIAWNRDREDTAASSPAPSDEDKPAR